MLKLGKKILLFGLVVAVVAAAWIAFQLQAFLSSPISQEREPAIIEIEAGASAASVANRLHRAGLLDAPKWYVWYLRYHGLHGRIKTGEMRIDPKWTVAQLTEALIKGETVHYPVTLIAGQTFLETLQTIQSAPKLETELQAENPPALYQTFDLTQPDNLDAQRYPYAGLEGWFLPETYHYQSGDTDRSVLLRAKQALQQLLDESWPQRIEELPLETPYDALILASIVEKETGVPEERPLIAGVFINRLKKGMRLQTDPTVIYGIGVEYDGNIRKKDLLTKTAYNTYRINGLPPTPIALPSREAIRAVLHPANTKALYFVSMGDGAHYFSETLAEHNRAVRKYQLQ